MTTLWIIGMWVVTISLMFGFVYLMGNVGFWVFAKVFGMIDSYMQDRYWRKRGFLRTMSQDGKDWYVGWDKE
jgi:hypothetical protein